MARTAPVPDIPPIPGMCPSIAVLAGGGDGGGGSGGAAGDGSGDDNAGGSGSGENAEGDSRGAPDYDKYPECGYASHPVDVVTGRAFTHPITDLALSGPLPLEWKRMYSSKMAHRDMGLGHGWAHSFGWEIEVARRRLTVWNEQGIGVDFGPIPVGGEALGPWGWVLRRTASGYRVDASDGLFRTFVALDETSARLRLTTIEDLNHNRISLTYDAGRLVEAVDSAGRHIRFAPTKHGRIGAILVQNAVSQGQWITFAAYTYDEAGDLVAVTDADGATARFAYDADHRLTLDVDRAGLAFHFVYDDKGRCVESWGDYPGRKDPSLAAGLPRYLHDGTTRAKGIHHCKLDYFEEGYTEVADSTQTRRFFGSRHGTLSKSVVGGAVMTAAYSDDGHLLSRTDALGATTTFVRDARGRILNRVDPLGRVTIVERDANGLPIQIVDPAGGATRIERDPRGNALVQVDASGAVTTLRCDERGLVTESVDERGFRTTYAYDAQGNLVGVTDPNGAARRFTYDAFGRRLTEVDPLGAERRYVHSARGDLLAVHDPLGGVTRYEYDGEQHLIRMVDPSGRATEMVWGGYHKLCVRRDACGNEVLFRYNLEGELVEIRNELGEVHLLERDASGKLVAEKTFDGRTLRYRNDLLGRPIRITTGLGHKTVLTYDLAGQLVSREFWDGSIEEFEYTARGELTVARSAGGECRFERDATGRIVREIQRVGDDEHSVTSDYDPTGRCIARSTSLGHTETIERDSVGMRARTVLGGGHVVEHQNDLLGREIVRSLPGSGRIASAYDALGRLSGRRVVGGGTERAVAAGEPEWLGARHDHVTAEVAYRYDWDGELIESWDRLRGRTAYEYDPVRQLVAALPEKARSELFRYDAAGNVYESGAGAATREYGPGNRLTRKGDTHYRSDEDGRLVEAQTGDGAAWHYLWNGAGMLSAAQAPDGTLVEFTYDAFARRTRKSVFKPSEPGREPALVAATRFVWDGNVLIHEITRAARAAGDPVVATRTYCFEDDGLEPIAQADGYGEGPPRQGWFHYVNDPAGTPERLVDEAGAVACDLARAAWGSAQPRPGSTTTTAIRLQGQYADEETGLTYNGFRYYDSDTGRFISPDPIELNGGFNTYAYAKNPISWIDPDGLAKRGPKPKDPVTGRGGPHNDTIMDRIGVLSGPPHNMTHVAGGTLREEVIDTSAVSATGRPCRRPDITMRRPDGSLYRENVGRREAGGARQPVRREREARADLAAATGAPIGFTPYN